MANSPHKLSCVYVLQLMVLPTSDQDHPIILTNMIVPCWLVSVPMAPTPVTGIAAAGMLVRRVLGPVFSRIACFCHLWTGSFIVEKILRSDVSRLLDHWLTPG